MPRAAEEFKQQSEASNITGWIILQCSLCKFPLAFYFKSEGVFYDNGCYCTYCSPGENLTPRSWQDVADFYNCQSNPKTIQEMDAFWGFQSEIENPKSEI